MPANKAEVKVDVKTTTTKSHRASINKEQLLAALKLLGIECPSSADVCVHVPGGGDWSNMALSIDNDCQIQVSWKTTETS